ncbi:uncharacterized protein F5147DRAFT_842725 [Suillus discolor]|uniref:Uncharacterized protein n=1 Tax=Suillus discolor TaxID=1912936 RepID=A0A9P7JKU9_9AGAM|nr:uncharacterized protein F5147DRAFT_842725 [Suillus discolor]KAG2080425.1 hypothetical protein F5147DRAFT_842725 [Suillus discolor]
MATKDEAGCLNWITLRVAEHHRYVSVATSLILGGVYRPLLLPMVKRTLFVFLLERKGPRSEGTTGKEAPCSETERAAKRERVRKETKNPASKKELAKRDSIATRTCQKAVEETVSEMGSTPRVAAVALPVESPPRLSTPHSVCSTQVTASSGKSLLGDKLLAFQALVARRPEFGTMRRSELNEGQKVYNRETCCCGFRFGEDGLPVAISTQNHLAGQPVLVGSEWFNEPRKPGHYTINNLIL